MTRTPAAWTVCAMTATRGGARGRRSGVTRRSVAALVLLAGAGLGAVACRSAAPPAATPPYNLLLVSLDTVRRDVLGYGQDRAGVSLRP